MVSVIELELVNISATMLFKLLEDLIVAEIGPLWPRISAGTFLKKVRELANNARAEVTLGRQDELSKISFDNVRGCFSRFRLKMEIEVAGEKAEAEVWWANASTAAEFLFCLLADFKEGELFFNGDVWVFRTSGGIFQDIAVGDVATLKAVTKSA